MKNFHDLFNHEFQDIYTAEVQIEKLLPECAKAVHSHNLKVVFLQSAEETKEQISKLKRLAQTLNIKLEGHECSAMKSFIQETHKVLQADYPQEVRDAALISAIQRIKHYEIALYGTLKTFAKHLGLKEAEKVLQDICTQERQTDKHFTEIAIGTMAAKGINEQAVHCKM